METNDAHRHYLDKEREASKIRKEMNTAVEIIRDGISRYKKKQLRTRSRKASDDLRLFSDLEDYADIEEIRDTYGWGLISMTEMDRLMNLWEKREQHLKDSGRYSDPVIEMLEKAIRRIGEEHQETLGAFELMRKQREADIARHESDAFAGRKKDEV